VEQPTTGRLEGVEPPAEVDGDSTTEMEGDHVAGLKEGWTRQYMGGAPPPPVGLDRGLFFLSSSIRAR
jgi:hypothetical protein